MTSPVTIYAGQPVLATDFDAYENLTAVWTSFTPTWASFGTQPAIGNGTLSGKYTRVGNYVAFSIQLVPGSTTTFGTSEYTLTTPTSIATNTMCGAFLEDNSAGLRYTGSARIDASSIGLVAIVFANGTSGWTAGSPVTLATNDIVRFAGVYEGA